MPIEYASMISLRLDNNIIFYEHTTGAGGAFNIYDSYAISGKSSITTKLFQWPKENASLNIQMRALEGRKNLNRAILRYPGNIIMTPMANKQWKYVLLSINICC